MATTLRKRLGGRLLVERVQVLHWNVATAARHAKVDAKAIGRIERGENYEWDSLEKYAIALGHALEWWLKEVLVEESHRRAG